MSGGIAVACLDGGDDRLRASHPRLGEWEAKPAWTDVREGAARG